MTDSGNDQIHQRVNQDIRDAITEHLQVEATDGSHVGTVDHLQGDYIKLTRSDSTDHTHHWIPLDWVRGADDVRVTLDKTLDEVHQNWMDSDPNE